MARGPCTFKQRDVTAAVKAVVAAGVAVARVEIDREGKIILMTGKASDGEPASEKSDLDSWIAKNANASQGA
jgi:hypothetical protein